MRHILFPAAHALAVASLGAAEPAPPKADGEKPVRVLFIGDSYTISFYSVLTGESPVGLPARIESKKAERRTKEEGNTKGQGGKLLCDVPAEEARFLQEVAWKTAQRFK